VQRWLDEIYTGVILEEWTKRYHKAAEEFRDVFINNIQPFASDPSLSQVFDRLFDGVEVLPVCLEGEYRKIYKENPLEASQLLVPVSWKQLNRLKKQQKVFSKPNTWPVVVNVEYSSEYGLML